MGYFQIPLNLPHAGTIAERIHALLVRGIVAESEDYGLLLEISSDLMDLLWPYRALGENPREGEAKRIQQEAARLGRALVDQIVKFQVGSDRLGQCVRNLFECLELGEEGAELSLHAGENPNSLQRPT